MTGKFTHLHLHTDGSFLDSAITPKKLIDRVVELGDMHSIAITDHGSLSNAFTFFHCAKENNIHPIIGIEAYLVYDRNDLNHDQRSHITLLAMNKEGWENLLKIHTVSYRDWFYQKPCIDYKFLFEHNTGIICLSGCMASHVNRAIRGDNYKKAQSIVEKMKEIFGDRYYIEIQRINVQDNDRFEDRLLSLAQEFHIKVAATNDVHFLKREHHTIHDMLCCTSMGKTFGEEGKLTYSKELYLKSGGEMHELFSNMPEAIESTLEIAERCQLDLAVKRNLYPVYDRIPEDKKMDTEEDTQNNFLYHLVREKYREKIPCDLWKDTRYSDRVKYELETIFKMGYSSYFLIVWDFVNWCDKNNIPVGPGRGCLAPNSQIYKSDGSAVNISDIKVGDKVISNSGSIEVVQEVFQYDCDEDLVLIKSFYGDVRGVSLTKDHKIFAEKLKRPVGYDSWTDGLKKANRYIVDPSGDLDWIDSNNIDKGDWVFIPKPIVDVDFIKDIDLANYIDSSCCKFDEEYVYEYHKNNGVLLNKIKRFVIFDEEFSFILGYFTGDGWLRSPDKYSSYPIVGFAVNKEDSEISIILNDFCKKYNIKYYSQESGELTQYTLKSRSLRNLFRSLFDKYNNISHTKHIPDVIINSDELILKAYIDGLCCADGHIENNSRIRITTVSNLLATQLRFCLLRLLIPSSLKIDNRVDKRTEYKNSSISYCIEYPMEGKKKQNYHVLDNGILLKIKDKKIIKNNYNKVYDIQVSNNHNYLTSSFIVHNSAGGSLVCYLLGITLFDPIKADLIFERFLNPGRTSSPPDIDTDIAQDRRDEVIRYVFERYGHQRCSMIGTFGTCKLKTLIRDGSRVLKIPLATADAMAKSIPEYSTIKVGFDFAIKDSPKFAKFYQDSSNDSSMRLLFEFIKEFEGSKHHSSKHAAGVVIAPEGRQIDEFIPQFYDRDKGIPFTAVDMGDVEQAGLLKMDFLGLSTLTQINEVVELTQAFDGGYYHFLGWTTSDEGLCDEKVIETVFRNQNTLGIFQFEFEGMQGYMKQLGITEFEDLVVLTSAARPGAKDFIPYMSECKHGIRSPEYDDPRLEPILKRTWGVILYQEQAIQLFREMAGLSLADADIARRAIGKKKEELLKKLEKDFVEGSIKNGYSSDVAKTIFDKIALHSGYSFNRSHAYAYSLISWMTAWLKTHYPAEFMAVMLTHGNMFKKYIEECSRLGIVVLPATVNHSKSEFSVKKYNPDICKGYCYYDELYSQIKAEKGSKVIISGTGRIKDVPEDYDFSENGPYSSIEDFVRKNPKINSKIMDQLIYAGALDCFGIMRSVLSENMESILKSARKIKKHEDQEDLFADAFEDNEEASMKQPEREWTLKELFLKEMSATDHCFIVDFKTAFEKDIQEYANGYTISNFIDSPNNTHCIFVGIVYTKKWHKSKKSQKNMMFLNVGDFEHNAEVALFDDALRVTAERMGDEVSENLIREGDVVCVNCKHQGAGKFAANYLKKVDVGS